MNRDLPDQKAAERIEAELVKAKSEILQRLEDLTSDRNRGKVAPVGTKVLVADSASLTQKDKAAVPLWFTERDQYSNRTAIITGYRGGYYMLDVEKGKNQWPGRWLKKLY